MVLVAVFPAASRAMALSVCDPFAAVVVFHCTEYGAVVSSVPTSAPSSLNRTPTTPTSSDADAVIEIVPVTDALAAGLVRVTTGAVRSLLTVTATGNDTPVLPASSQADAFSVCGPFVVCVVFQITEYGEVVTTPPTFAPSSMNWTPATRTSSDALADNVMLLPATVAPFWGADKETVGATVS